MTENFNDEVSRDNSAQTNEAPRKVYIIDIPDEDIVDNPDNYEDVSHTEDLELSIKENGFIDPIDVTDYGMESGKYMIVSGHRRRKAGKELGMDSFPCIIRSFQSREEMINQMLLSQSFRDSSKNPLLYVFRYMMHKKYLKEIGFKGSVREEIATRMGLSVQQVDRYANVGKMIRPVQDAIERGTMSVSSAQPLASHSDDDQAKIMAIVDEALAQCQCELITLEQVRDIVKAYDAGAKDYGNVLEWKEQQELSEGEHQDEDPAGEIYEADDEHSEDVEDSDDKQGQAAYTEPPCVPGYMYDDYEDLKDTGGQDTEDTEDNGYELKDETRARLRQQHTDRMFRVLKAVENALQEKYECKDKVEAGKLMTAYKAVVTDLIKEMDNLAAMMDMPGEWTKSSQSIRETLDACDNMQDQKEE